MFALLVGSWLAGGVIGYVTDTSMVVCTLVIWFLIVLVLFGVENIG